MAARGGRARTPGLTRPAEISERLEAALTRSPADETELVWLEARRGRASVAPAAPRPVIERSLEHTVLVRVIDRGRVGSHRTGAADPSALDDAVRAAMAQSRARPPLPGLPHLPSDEGPPPKLPRLRDRAVARLGQRGIAALLEPLDGPSESARLRWAEARVAVFSSRGLRRGASATAIEVAVRCGDGPEGGRAVDASRSLAGLHVAELVDRARSRRREGRTGRPPAEAPATVLSPEATARLCDLVNRETFSAAAYSEGGSLLREHLGIQVFDRALSLRDDATDPAGLPFPFDLEGTPKRPIDLIERGTPRTPALDQRQAALLGLPPTAHAVAGADARAENLFLLPGEHTEEQLLGLADGGLWVGWIEPLECFEPTRLQIRAVLRGVRRIRDARLAEPLPDLIWKTALLRTLSDLVGIGSQPSRALGPGGYLGGISTPAVAVRVPAAELTSARRADV